MCHSTSQQRRGSVVNGVIVFADKRCDSWSQLSFFQSGCRKKPAFVVDFSIPLSIKKQPVWFQIRPDSRKCQPAALGTIIESFSPQQVLLTPLSAEKTDVLRSSFCWICDLGSEGKMHMPLGLLLLWYHICFLSFLSKIIYYFKILLHN